LERPKHSLGWIAAAALAALNLYFCREALFIEFSGYANSMHGFWMALAGLPGKAWLIPSWWPWWDGGMPLEFTYAPLVPWLTGGIAALAGIPVSHAWHIVTVLVICVGPVTLFWACHRLTNSISYGLAAALIYCLVAPTELLAPDSTFAWQHFLDARRLYLSFVWDETPHLASLAIFPLALLSWIRLLERPGRAAYALAIPATAAVVLANAFGATLLALALLLLLSARPREWRVILQRLGLVGLAAYFLVSPWMPPSLIATLVRNTNLYPEGAWTADSPIALLMVALAWTALAALLDRLGATWFTRFWLLMAFLTSSVIALHHHLDWHFLPQPARYKMEAELALAVALVFCARPLLDRLPLSARLALVAVLLPACVWQVIAHRRFAKNVIRSVVAEQTVEYQVARWLEQTRPDTRVFAPGSIAGWLRTFAAVPQVGGGPFTTAINPVQQMAVETVYGQRGLTARPAELELLWMKAFGADTVIVSGRQSREFWKPFRDPKVFTTLPLLWGDSDTMIYQVPARHYSLAHVLPAGALVVLAPRAGDDVGEIRRYVAALDDESLPAAELHWQGSSRALVRARTAPGQAISVQINYHTGWRASDGGRPVPIRADGLGLMVLDPRHSGAHAIELRFTGGWEALATRAVAAAVIAAGLFLSLRKRIARRA